jgi:hypothetical protein
MKQPRVYVDFNEMVASDEVLLSKLDTTLDSAGHPVSLLEGAPVAAYMDDPAENGAPDRLIADGVAIRNRHGGWTAGARWILKIDSRGIRRESDEGVLDA